MLNGIKTKPEKRAAGLFNILLKNDEKGKNVMPIEITYTETVSFDAKYKNHYGLDNR